MSRSLHSHQEPQRGIRPTCGSISVPLLRQFASEEVKGTSVFAAEIVQIPSLGAGMPLPASASPDVLQWLQIPNLDV